MKQILLTLMIIATAGMAAAETCYTTTVYGPDGEVVFEQEQCID